MKDEYSVPANESKFIMKVKNSRFIGYASRTESVQEAVTFIHQKKEKEKGCTHAVYAYCIGFGKSVVLGMSDAGEPSGTAGRPVLEVLKGSGIGDITVVVIRYFGGIKLGTGGLVHAYSETAKETISKLKVIKKQVMKKLCILLKYENYNPAYRLIIQYNGEILEKTFDKKINLIVNIPDKQISNFIALLQDVCSGKASIKEV